MSSTKKDYYAGVRFAPYDIVKEFLIAMGIVTVLVVILAAALSSPDEPPLTLQSVATQTPLIYTQAALSELDGTNACTTAANASDQCLASPIASYGPPYNNQSSSVQTIGPFSPQRLVGIRIPINTVRDYVIDPLSASAANDPTLKAALTQFEQAGPSTQNGWEVAYTSALNNAKAKGQTLTVPACANCGPVTELMSASLRLAQSGAMDGQLLKSRQFFETDYTKPLLFMQNDAVANHAAKFNLLGSTWGVMNETGNYPGQAWLWLYTMFYQIPPYTTAWAANADAMAIVSITILTLILMFLPWIPGLNRLPKWLRVYRLIWRDYYREQR